MIDLSNILHEKIDRVKNQIRKAATERDESATPTESTHDQTRQIANQLYNSLLEEKKHLEEILPKLKRFNHIYRVKKVGGIAETNFMIVPDGLGGIMTGMTLLVGEASPIGMILASKKSGDKYEFNETPYVVVDIFENR